MPIRAIVRHACMPAICSVLLLGSVQIYAQQQTHTKALRFYPSSLNSEFSSATRVTVGRVNITGLSSLMLSSTPVPQAESSAEEDQVARYEQQIDSLEEVDGRFSATLFEPLLSLGLLYQTQGKHEQALAILDRATFLNKTRQGLYSAGQIALIRHQLTSVKALGEATQTQDLLERLVLVHQKLYGSNHNETAFARLELGSWKLDNFLKQLSTHPDTRLVASSRTGDLHPKFEAYTPILEDLYTAQRTFIDAITSVVDNQDFADERLYTLENELIATFYLNAKREEILAEPDATWAETGRNFSSIKRLKQLEALPADYHNGEASYQRQLQYLQHNEHATLGQLNHTMLALADWYQLFGQYDKAREQRERLADILGKTDLGSDEITDLMQQDSPVILPTFIETPLSPRPFSPDKTLGHIDLAIQITAWGEVSDVETLGMSDNTSEQVVNELVALVKSARFRVDSKEGSTSGIRYYYQ